MYRGGGGAYGVAAITGGTAFFTAKGGLGGVTAPSIGWSDASAASKGFDFDTNRNAIYVADAGNKPLSFNSNGLGLQNNGVIEWSSSANDSLGSFDLLLSRAAAGVAGLSGSTTAVGASLRRYGGNAGYVEWGSVSENLTLSTSGTTTDTAANLLPADSYIESVTGRVTTTVATATSWQLGDPTTAGRFTAAQSGGQLTAGATVVGLVQCDVTGAGGPRQTAAAKVRVTTVGTPSAGAIRITSYYRTFVAPTS